MAKVLTETQHQLEQTQQQLDALRLELDKLRGSQPIGSPSETLSDQVPSSATPQTHAETGSIAAQVARQQEEQEILQAEVKQHDQTKLESASRYPVRVYGLMLFNAFSNAGVVDNPDLPSVAIARLPDQSHGSIGGSFRQTVLGLSANGPRLFGARSTADLSVDFFGGSSYSYYSTTNGSARLRRADIRLAWGSGTDPDFAPNELHLGVDAPLISPLSPTSFATIGMPALAWSGNLWSWAPQLRFKHTVLLPDTNGRRNLQLEGGLWDPPAVGTNGAVSGRVLSAGELSRRPGFLGRAAFNSGSAEHPFAVGLGGFSERQTYYEGHSMQMWAITSDWQIPLSNRLQLTGEIYRGRGLGGLGGGAYKDVLTGLDTHTGLSRTLALNAVGGWAQLGTHLFEGAEANLIYGQDGGFASDFRKLNLSASTYILEQSARNQMMVANLIFRPRTYLIFSPEYRRILSWKIQGVAATANIYTLSLGYEF